MELAQILEILEYVLVFFAAVFACIFVDRFIKNRRNKK